jgi:hypothetical protein
MRPHNAAAFCTIPRGMEQNVDWLTAVLADLRDSGHVSVEPTAEAACDRTHQGRRSHRAKCRRDAADYRQPSARGRMKRRCV